MGVPARQVGGTRTPGDPVSGALAGRFILQERLGDGGMGEVFCAFDTTLKRLVAIKRISRSTSDDSASNQKLLHEAQRACALNDPHIATVYDVVEHGGELFLVMERVEGKTLRDVMQQSIPLDRFYDISIQCAQALQAAHSHGIVHGDIKPENIMITPSGDVKVLDFGVARLVRDADPTASTLDSADAHSSGGTFMYMAPEVLRQRSSDIRADIFSLGVVCYEMLAHKHPFLDSSLATTIDNVLHVDPPIVSASSPAIPHTLGVVVRHAMAKDPEQRCETAFALQRALHAARLGNQIESAPPARHQTRWILIGLVVLAMAAIVWRMLPRRAASDKQWEEPVHPAIVAVLPFTSSDKSAEIQALGNGIADEVSSRLNRLTEDRPLQVIPTSLLREKGATTVPEARQRFGIDFGITITATKKDGNNQIKYEVANAEKGKVLARDTIIVHPGDLAVEDAISHAAVKALGLKLRAGEESVLSARGTSKPVAFDYYLRARGYLLEYAREENVNSAILLLNEAVKLDPNFGMAKAALGEAYWREYYHTKDSQWTAKASAECNSAVALGNAGAAGHMCLGLIDADTGKYAEAEQEYRRAIELEPTSYAAYTGLASVFEHQGNAQEAESTYQRAIDFRPQDWLGYNNIGNFYYRHAEYDKAIAMFEKVTRLAPESFAGYVNLAAVYNDTGRYQDSIEPLKKSIAIRPTFYAYTNLGAAYFGLRQYKPASEALSKAVELSPKSYLTWGNLGQAYHLQGKKSSANKALQKAVLLALEELKVNPSDGLVLSDLADYESVLGNRSESLRYLQQALQYGRNDKVILFSAATTYYQLGEVGLCLEWLNRAIQAGYSLDKIKQSPTFESLHSDSRYQQLVQPRK